MTSIPDLIANWRKRRLDGDVSFGVLVDETIDLLTRLTAPGDEGLETTEDDLIALEELERDEYLKGVDIANIDKLIRDFDLLRAKLRAAEERADRAAKALGEMTSGALGYTDVAALKARADRYEAALQWIDENCGVYEIYSVARRALDPEPKP